MSSTSKFILATTFWAVSKLLTRAQAAPEDTPWQATLRAHVNDTSAAVVILRSGPDIIFLVPEEVGRILEAQLASEVSSFLSVLNFDTGPFTLGPAPAKSPVRDQILSHWALVVSRRLHGTCNGLTAENSMLGYRTRAPIP